MKPVYLEKSLGVDIREESAALILLARGLRSVDVLGGHFFRIAPLRAGNENAEKHFLQEANQFLMKNDVWPENVTLSIPRRFLTFQSFDLPAPDRKSVDSMVEFELERHFSSGLENLYHASHISARPDNIYNVASVAVKKEVANYYLELMNRLGLKTTTLNVSTFANANLILANGRNSNLKDEICAIVDVGLGAIDITIVKNRIIELTRSVPMDETDYGQGFSQPGLSKDRYPSYSDALSKIIIEELQSALSSCKNISDAESIENIYLINGGLYAPFLVRQLQKNSEVETSRVPESSPDNSPFPEKISGAFMATAYSLGMRELKRNKIEINLLPAELRPNKKHFNIKTTLALAAAVVVMLIGFSLNKIIRNNVTLSSLSGQLDEIKGKTGSLEKIDLEYYSLKKSVDTLNNIAKTYPLKLAALIELSQTLPTNTWLTKIKISGNELEIRGFSTTASKLVPLIENSARFKEAGFVGSIVKTREGEKFTLKALIQ